MLLVSKAIGSLRWDLPFRAKRRNGGKFQWRSAKGRLPSKSRFFVYFFLKKWEKKIYCYSFQKSVCFGIIQFEVQ
jgi:hypothetical protein